MKTEIFRKEFPHWLTNVITIFKYQADLTGVFQNICLLKFIRKHQ